MIWTQVEKEKEGRIEIGVGYVGGVERKQEKKKRKKKGKRNVWMKLRKEK